LREAQRSPRSIGSHSHGALSPVVRIKAAHPAKTVSDAAVVRIVFTPIRAGTSPLDARVLVAPFPPIEDSDPSAATQPSSVDGCKAKAVVVSPNVNRRYRPTPAIQRSR
jgi:hypothetical protein